MHGMDVRRSKVPRALQRALQDKCGRINGERKQPLRVKGLVEDSMMEALSTSSMKKNCGANLIN